MCCFRLHKNDRSQRDPEPYKRRMGAGLKRGGRPRAAGGLLPGHSARGAQLAGGRHLPPHPGRVGGHPAGDSLQRRRFSPAAAGPGAAAILPGGLDTTGPQLTRPPRGYAADDPDLAWLRLKTYGTGRFYADAEVLSPDFVPQVVAAIAAARPLVDFFNDALPQG
jgi:hypothetical protein